MILTKSQGERLTTALHAARPEWATASIATILQNANRNEGLPGHDFDHALRAAIAYATARNPIDGKYLKQTPGFIAERSTYWDTTAPETAPQPERPHCQEHHWAPIPCRPCQDEIDLGDRNPEHLNKRRPGLPLPPAQARANANRVREAIRQARTTEGANHAPNAAETHTEATKTTT